MDINNLMIPMFALYNFESIKNIELKLDDAEYLKNFYTLNERQNIGQALLWAKENPSFDFKGIMKEAPVTHKLKFSNKEIFKYLMNFKQFMESEEYELLTEDRPIKKAEDFL
ncbi:hypothetical protein ACI6PS_10740 [Flavobacterium sp. PLA-1-15]|uniref:hypothetical protein n=1 Tax=Flavobacterium sp. PLA-1-15 TaxID=3380533 RepID=UPI003B7DA4D9